MALDQIEIRSSGGAYRVHPYDSLPGAIEAAIAADAGKPVFCLIDRQVGRLHPGALGQFLPPERVREIEANEPNKSLDKLQDIILWLLDSGIRRNHRLLVVGGGVVQDIGCFIASVLFRGIAWEFVPTTLLAQCDSCIGAKSSINVAQYKNQIGTFYPPREVRLASAVLNTLPLDEIRSGMGEIIKLHLVAGETEFNLLRQTLAELSPADFLPEGDRLAKLTWSALRIKQKFIEEDEFDQGIRNLLNYGHTFGHAYESATNYAIPHGIAVTLGMGAATYLSESLGMIPSGSFDQLNAVFRPWYDPFQAKLAAVDPASILAAMRKDKKNLDDRVTCILTAGAGAMKKVPLQANEQILPSLIQFIKVLNS